jgi:hypothetical protein
MTHTSMASNAGESGSGSSGWFDVMRDVLMTLATGAFGDEAAAFLNLNRLMKFAGGKCERMKKAVLGFGEVFRDQSGWCMAVVAGRDRAMTGFDPAIEVILHDVAISTGARVVA